MMIANIYPSTTQTKRENKMEYWKGCIEEAFSENEISATDEQIKSVVEWVEGAHENIGMETGSEHIPNPANSEIAELKAKIRKLEAAHEKQINGVLKGVAHRRNVDVSDVDIDNNGFVTYR